MSFRAKGCCGIVSYDPGVQQLEFFVEPFTEGQPGPHVTAAVSAVEEAGGIVEFGPFSSSCRSEDDRMPAIVASLLTAAFAYGATSVRLSVDQVGDGSPVG